jgi:hypothetical protein
LVTVVNNGQTGEPISLVVHGSGAYFVFDESTGQVAEGTLSTEQFSVARMSSETVRELLLNDCGSADFSACRAAVSGYFVDAVHAGGACFDVDSLGPDCPTDDLQELIALYEVTTLFE